MKSKAESLGTGFYLSLLLLGVVAALWFRLEPRRMDSESLSRLLHEQRSASGGSSTEMIEIPVFHSEASVLPSAR